MNENQTEVLKKFAAMILRRGIYIAGAWLIKKNVIDEPTLNSITTPEFLAASFGVISIGLTAAYDYWNAKYLIALPKAALAADPGTPLEAVKADVKSKL